MSKKLFVEIIGNKNYHFQPYPKTQNTLEPILETSNFDTELVNQLENTISNFSNSNMNLSTSDVSELLKTLPYFNADDNLPLFIAKVEDTIATLHTFTLTPFQNALIKQSILSKIKGQATANIFLENTSDWPQIKKALIKYYGDHRNENLLNSNLRQSKQSVNETTIQFYHKINEAQNALIQFSQLHLTNEEILKYEINKIKTTSLEQFRIGIREPYRTILSYANPTTLEEALLKCHEYDNNQTAIRQLHNFQNPKPNIPIRNNPPQQIIKKFTNEPKSPIHNNSIPRQNAFNQPPYRPFGDINKPPPIRQYYPTNSQVFGTPRPPYSNQTKQSGQNNYKPTPMSVQTANYQPSSKQFTQPNKNFVSRELHNTEINEETPENQFHEQNFQEYDDTGSYDYNEYPVHNSVENPDENFHEIASDHPQLT